MLVCACGWPCVHAGDRVCMKVTICACLCVHAGGRVCMRYIRAYLNVYACGPAFCVCAYVCGPAGAYTRAGLLLCVCMCVYATTMRAGLLGCMCECWVYHQCSLSPAPTPPALLPRPPSMHSPLLHSRTFFLLFHPPRVPMLSPAYSCTQGMPSPAYSCTQGLPSPAHSRTHLLLPRASLWRSQTLRRCVWRLRTVTRASWPSRWWRTTCGRSGGQGSRGWGGV